MNILFEINFWLEDLPYSIIEQKIWQEYAPNFLSHSHKNGIMDCVMCGICRDTCPTYQILPHESSFMAGKMRVYWSFTERREKTDPATAQILAFCTTCGACQEVCPLKVKTVSVIEQARGQMVKRTHDIYGNIAKFGSNIQNVRNPYGDAPEKRIIDLKKEGNTKISLIGFFIGCTLALRDPENARKIVTLLNKIYPEGIELLGADEYCCGSPLLRTGQLSLGSKKDPFEVSALVRHNIEAFETHHLHKILFSCSGCFKTATQDWPELLDSPERLKKLQFQDTTQLLAELITHGKLQFKPFPKIVTYHDPCHLGRALGIYEEPRKILQSIPSLKLVEMEHHGFAAICCGAGGGVKAGFPDQSLELAKNRVLEAQKTGAELIITVCIFCKRNLQDAVDSLQSSLKVLCIEEFIAHLQIRNPFSYIISQNPWVQLFYKS